MRVVSTVQEMMDWCSEVRGSQSIGLLPTMGYLHEGHLSLARPGRRENTLLVASIFVNPTQFGPHEDLDRYPRDLPRDLQLLTSVGVDVVFTPTVAEMYPSGFTTYVDPVGALVEQAEGARRPGHFRGVATIVLKLFQIVQPHRAYFGQKDAQQIAVISRMVTDFNLPVTLRILPTVREADGLAMSSRNAYLNAEARTAATVLYKALQVGQQMFEAHPKQGPSAVEQAMVALVAAEPLAQLDYAEVHDPNTFLPLETLRTPALLAIAARIGPTRLIDNFLLRADGTWEMGVGVS